MYRLLFHPPTEEASIYPRMGPSNSRRGLQVTRDELHQGSILSQLASKRGDGLESFIDILYYPTFQ